ncbi:rRNA maturation RNase YbeY [uncultured Muriicola sp.]|uniref:rRNA maturation RNase YbeY n=1 Tax=uncultured Muriicola sp. TaxID=1583102 RepID=UPI002610CFEB|nr:rRNA maturation RNase YbeY [uncultured Muriicola sp.]
MIDFVYETDFKIVELYKYTDWLKSLIISEDKIPGNLCFVLTTDDQVLEINKKYLGHTDFTDVITFDYTKGSEIHGDILISMDRIKENAKKYKVKPEDELRRVMAHGVLHLVGYTDKTKAEKKVMREKENEKLKMFHVEQ